MKHPIPISAYIEALQHSELQAPELRHLVTVHNFEREGFFVSQKAIKFLLSDKKREYILTVPTNLRFDLTDKAISTRIVDSDNCDYLTASQYIPKALTLFDSYGKVYQSAALLQERHTPLFDFIRRHCSAAHRPILHSAIESLWFCAHTLSSLGIRHGGLKSSNICFDKQGGVRLADYPIAPTSRNNDIESLSEAAILLYIGGSELTALKYIHEQIHNSRQLNRIGILRIIASAAEHHGSTSLAELTKGILNKANQSAILRLLQRFAAEPFTPLPLLTQLLLNHRHAPITIIPPESEPQAEPHVRIDFALCDQVMPASDLIIRYRKGNYWGYAHHDGEQIVLPKPLIGASDFEEGRAVVLTQRGYGMIDTCGNFVLSDHWSQLCWYCNENIATAADSSGRWHIYDRMGHQLSAVPCDWMGDAAEGFVVARRGDKYGYFSTDGRKRTDFIYDEAYAFSGGIAMVVHAGHRYHIDTTLHGLSPREERLLGKEP